MASNLPTFEQTAQVEPGPVVSDAPVARAEAQVLNTVGQTAANIGQNKLDSFIKEKGEQAGMNPNFVPKEGFGPENELFNNSALATNKQFIANDIADHNNTLLTAAAQNPDANKAMAQYTTAMHIYGKNTLQNVPAANRASALELFKYHLASGQLQLQKRVNKQNNIEAGISYENTAQSRHDSLIGAIQSDNEPAAQQILNQGIQANELAATGGVITLPEMSKANATLRNTMQTETILHQYRNALTQGTAPKFLQDFQKKDIPGVSSQQKEKLFNNLMVEQRQYNQSIGVTRATTQKNFSNMISDIWQGGKVNNRVMTNYQSTNPGQFPQAQEDLQDAQTGFSVVQAAAHLPASQQQGYIDSRLKPTGNENSSLFNRKLRLYNQVQRQVSNINKQMASDPIGFAQQHPFIVNSVSNQQIQNDSNAPAEAAANPDSTVKTVEVNPIDQMVNLQKQHGVPNQSIKVMSNNVAKQTASTLTNLPPLQKHQYIQKLQAMYGPHFNSAVTQLKKEGVPRTTFWIGSIAPTDPMFTTVNNAYSTPDKDLTNALTKDQQTAMTQAVQSQIVGPANEALSPFKTPSFIGKIGAAISTEFNSNVKNYMASMGSYQSSQNVQHINDLSQWADRVGKQYLITHGGSASTAVDNGINAVVGKFNYETVNGATVRIPQGMNQDAIVAYAKDMQHNLLPAFPFSVDQGTANLRGIQDVDSTTEKVATEIENFFTGGGLSTNTLQGHLIDKFNKAELQTSPRDLYYNQEVKSGHWATLPDNSGMMWVQQNGKPAHTKAGKLFEFKYKDALNNYAPDYGSVNYYAREAVRFADAKADDLIKIAAGPNAPEAVQQTIEGN